MSETSNSIYLRLKRRVKIHKNQLVKLHHIATILTHSPALEEKLNGLSVYQHRDADGNRVVIDLLQVIRLIKKVDDRSSIEVYGDAQILLTVMESRKKPHYVLLVICWLLLFFGSGLTLMNFHADVNMKDTQIRLVELVTGERVDHPLWFQIPYSIGIGTGMVIFFNHIFKKKFNEEPNPLEVELFMYEENVNTFVVCNEMHKQDSQKGQHLAVSEDKAND